MAMVPAPVESKEESKNKNEPETGNQAWDPKVAGVIQPTSPVSARGRVLELSEQLRASIAKANESEGDSRRKRDPPILRRDCMDPPPSINIHLLLRDAPEQKRDGNDSIQSHISHEDLDYISRKPKSDIAYKNLGARASKIDDACKGFDLVQDKIARLKILLSAKEEASRRKSTIREQEMPKVRKHRHKQVPGEESLDSAFAKLSEIQAKMRALQALVRTNQI